MCVVIYDKCICFYTSCLHMSLLAIKVFPEQTSTQQGSDEFVQVFNISSDTRRCTDFFDVHLIISVK